VRQPVPQGQEGAVVDVEAGEKRDVGAAYADAVAWWPASMVAASGLVAEAEAEAEGDDGDANRWRSSRQRMMAMTVAVVKTPPSAHR